MKPLIITIDGPAAAGKGTIAKYIKKKFSFFHIDSGSLYRNLAKKILNKNFKLKDKKALKLLLKNTNEIYPSKTKNLKSLDISIMSSKIAKINMVRQFININQHKLVKQKMKAYKGFVVDGRDIGSVVFKNAQIKLYINADYKIRAKRRYKELIDRGEKSIYSNVLKEQKLRDKRDKNRKNSPLVIPKGAIVIDNTGNLTQTKRFVGKMLKDKMPHID